MSHLIRFDDGETVSMFDSTGVWYPIMKRLQESGADDIMRLVRKVDDLIDGGVYDLDHPEARDLIDTIEEVIQENA
jgi:hypothetical protein